MCFRIILSFFFIVWGCGIGLSQPFVCDGQFYLSLYNDDNKSILYEVNIDFDGSTNFSALQDSTGVTINAIGYRKTDNYIYGVHPHEQDLYRINANGQADFLTTLQGIDTIFNYTAGDITLDGNFLILIGTKGGIDRKVLVEVDLNSPTYEIQIRDLTLPNGDYVSGGFADVAFDPLTGILYGYNSKAKRLMIIDVEEAQIIDDLFAVDQEARILGALFFDAFGNLRGYGSPIGVPLQNTLYSVNKVTGVITAESMGPEARGNDGCSCPYTVSMNKKVFPEIVDPCAEVEYVFEIANASGEEQTGVSFIDDLPDDLVITDILYNPYIGNIDSGIGTSLLSISDLVIPTGIDSIIIKVEVAPFSEGIYNNQAVLNNLPEEIGGMVISDNPATITDLDSTQLIVNSVLSNLNELSEVLCPDSSLLLTLPEFTDATYSWNDGSEEATLLIDEPGVYAVTVMDGCNLETEITINVIENDLSLALPNDLSLNLGDSIQIIPQYINSNNIEFSWIDPLQNSLNCEDCESVIARPYFDVNYFLQIIDEDGCIVSDNINITVEKERNIYIPNVFSPNDDGRNDIFFIQGDEYAIIKEFRVFNRWGASVHEYENGMVNQTSHGWDGHFKSEKVNPGVYVWYTKIVFLDGVEEIYEGSITILK